MALALVNLGCGTRFHSDWVNIDLYPAGPGVRKANFIRGIPLPDRSAACIYHSHLFEHLPLAVARRFLGECRRVLAPGGILRIVVPDFERSARDHIATLDRRRAGENLQAAHRWLLIEMIDQIARTRPGGEMVQMIAEDDRHDDFIAARLGSFGASLISGVREQTRERSRPPRFHRAAWIIERCLPGRLGSAVVDAWFRQRGEIHMWMYDEFFLGDMLQVAGYVEPQRMTHLTSGIADWSRYGLDAEPDGSPYKGTSLYMEAKRPSTP